jgi:hypothetical protein
VGADYAWLKAFEDAGSCENIISDLERSCDGGLSWNDYFTGKFTCKDVRWDIDRCRATVNIRPNDVYACTEEFGDVPFNILSLSPEVSITNPGNPASYEYFADENGQCNPSTAPTGSGWINFFDDCDNSDPFNPISTITIWFREYKWTSCIAGNPYPPTGTGWVLDTNDCATTGLAKYVRVPPIGTPSPSTVWVSICLGTDPVNPNDDPNYSGTPSPYWELVYSGCYVGGNNWSYWWDRVPTSPVSFDHTRPLLQVVDEIAQFTCPTINGVISDFFDWNAAEDTPGYSPGINYVTGLSNKLTGIHISQKSDIIDPNASQPATVGELTFNELMQMFAVTFNAFWFIEGTKLRIEHISAYQYNLTLDLTTGTYATMLYGKNIYEYLTERRPRVEKFKFMEAFNQDFVGKDIEYFVDCIVPTIGRPRGGNSAEQSLLRENQITYDAGRFTTDLKHIEDNPGDINKDGFVLICTVDDGAGNLSVDYEAGLLSGNLMQNGHLAWANLHHAYHRHNRVLLSGNMNGTLTTFLSAQNTKQQKNVDIYGCCSFDLNGTDLVKTEIGFGEVDEYTENLFTNRVTLTLNY